MTPQEFKEALWNCFADIENISLECDRVTQEMMQGQTVNEYLGIALRAIALSINAINGEYFPECLEESEVLHQHQDS